MLMLPIVAAQRPLDLNYPLPQAPSRVLAPGHAIDLRVNFLQLFVYSIDSCLEDIHCECIADTATLSGQGRDTREKDHPSGLTVCSHLVQFFLVPRLHAVQHLIYHITGLPCRDCVRVLGGLAFRGHNRECVVPCIFVELVDGIRCQPRGETA